jgi:pimeloyl-ACP methyl ester carboxylesterase
VRPTDARIVALLVVALICGVPARAAAEPLREDRYVALGGIEQWITIRGEDREAPVLLWIHGGPAEVQSPLESAYEPWTASYRLVQWDQRGAGRTYQRNPGPPEAVTLDRIAADGIELTEYLQRRFSVSKIILAGHSWGSLVAITMARARPDSFELLVGTGQVSSWRETVKWQYEYALRKAREAGDAAVVQELETMGLPPHDNFAKYSAMRRKLVAYFPKVDTDWLQRQQALYRAAPGITPDDLKTFSAGGGFSMARLMPTIMAEDLRATIDELEIPFCVIQGSEDTFTPLEPARAFFEHVKAPVKRLHVVEGAGHFAAMTHTKEFLTVLAACLRSAEGARRLEARLRPANYQLASELRL